MGYYKIINGIRWYYRLKPQKQVNGLVKKGLFSDHPRHSLTNSLIVAISHHDINTQKNYLLFTHFKSYLEYGIYQMKLPQHERCFYEIILGESTQKPHFDVDIDNKDVNGEEIKDNLVDGIIKVLKQKGVVINVMSDILIYTSHGTEKQSYHIVVNNYCHANNVEAKAFYDAVMDHISSEYTQWIDRAVYSPTQQFRIVGSQKIGTERIKTFQKRWKYHGKEIDYVYPEPPDSPEHEMVMQLEGSIVGYTGNCKFLPPFEPKPEEIKHYTESEDVNPNDANEAINLIGLAGNISIHDPRFPYKFMGINGPIVMLKRTKPSRCKICCRVHEHENPYLLVIGEEKSVYFHCRRSPENKKLFLGKLNPSPETSKEKNGPPSPEEEKVNHMKIKWTKNVIEKVQKLARSGNSNDKKYINSSTQIDPTYKKQLINLYVNSK
jgi:hypothetical protein